MDTSAALRAAGLRDTRPRRAVLSSLAAQPHATAADIAARIGAAPPGTGHDVSRQGLYNVLDDLTRVALIRRIEPAGSPARYELQTDDNHHHLVCRRCGRMTDIDCAVGTAPCLTPSRTGGFTIDEAEVTWWGECDDCEVAAEDADAR